MTGVAGHGASDGGGWHAGGTGSSTPVETALVDRAHRPAAALSDEGRRQHEAFAAAIDDDLDTPAALRIAREVLRSAQPADERRWLVLDMDLVFGLDLDRTEDAGAAFAAMAGPDAATLTDEARRLLDERTARRAQRDFAAADRLRQQLRELGVEPIDNPDGSSDWRRLG
jgi:cysteinyl-tRNA synthetase